MRILIVGIGALGGTIAARGIHAGMSLSLATSTRESAETILASGLRVTGIGGDIVVRPTEVARLDDYAAGEKFDLILLATKAHQALQIAPQLGALLQPGGSLLPIQNGGISQILAQQLGSDIVLGGLSNLGATMVAPGVYRQSNNGHVLMGEITGGMSERAGRVSLELQRAIGTQLTTNMNGAIWSKLLLNCSVTTLGAVAGQTMRQYHATAIGREVFRRTYDETLSVALATGATPERMLVDPLPPDWDGRSKPGERYDGWIEQILTFYGDLKPSMLQDLERGRQTEVAFINGYVAELGAKAGIPAPLNAATTVIVKRIEKGELRPDPANLDVIAAYS